MMFIVVQLKALVKKILLIPSFVTFSFIFFCFYLFNFFFFGGGGSKRVDMLLSCANSRLCLSFYKYVVFLQM